MADITVKQGATLSLRFTVLNDDGTGADVSVATVTCWVRDAEDNRIAALPIVTTGFDGVLTAQADTSLWPIGRLRADIKVVVAGLVDKSQTFAIVIQRAVTA